MNKLDDCKLWLVAGIIISLVGYYLIDSLYLTLLGFSVFIIWSIFGNQERILNKITKEIKE